MALTKTLGPLGSLVDEATILINRATAEAEAKANEWSLDLRELPDDSYEFDWKEDYRDWQSRREGNEPRSL